IYNNIGQLQQTSSNLNSNGIDISNLAQGFYTYSVTDNQQNIKKIGKFIKE
ncbi:MAG: T9SS type A sorting domain-containing protein, partial [Bacteroidia bacterium]|nr:T9SS type A sorting domain-containing protein [Bacteroidia bacterium]